jgi:hypothetical protein
LAVIAPLVAAGPMGAGFVEQKTGLGENQVDPKGPLQYGVTHGNEVTNCRRE